jgi:hypothetical protein
MARFTDAEARKESSLDGFRRRVKRHGPSVS